MGVSPMWINGYMSDNNNLPELKTPNYSPFATKLRNGARVFPQRQAKQIALATFCALFLLFFFVSMTSTLIFLQTGKRNFFVTDNSMTDLYIMMVASPVIILPTIVLWGPLLFSSLQFQNSSLSFWDWKGLCRIAEFNDIVSACLRRHKSKGSTTWEVGILILTPGQNNGSSWYRIYFSFRHDIGETIFTEIVELCNLIAPIEEDSDSEDIFKLRPGHEPDFKQVPWWWM
jgi:hypothetical protein